MDYESLAAAGSIVGSGGMVVMDEDDCMVDVARYFLTFTQLESCGKCIPCRWGTKQMLDILEDIVTGKGREGDIELLLELGEAVKNGSLCALGGTAPNPVLTTIRYFRDEYEAHIKEKMLPGAIVQSAGSVLDRYGEVPGMRQVCAGLPRRRYHGQQGDRLHHRPGPVHQVRQLPGRLPAPIRRGGKKVRQAPRTAGRTRLRGPMSPLNRVRFGSFGGDR